MKRVWIKGILLLALVWALALSGMRILRAGRPTPDNVAAAVSRQDLAALPQAQRERVVTDFIRQVNRLSFSQRQQLHADQRTRRFYRALNDAERLHIFEETLTSGVSEMIQAFSRMPEDERERLLVRAQEDLDRFEARVGRETLEPVDEEALRKALDSISRQGLAVFLREADARTKMELQPLLERMQFILRRGGW